MREILFRGKRVDDGQFAYGYVGIFKGKTQIYVPFTEEEEKENDGHIFSAIGGLWHTVEPSTVGQFTGLTDKNGKKIFEGDVLKDITDGVPREVFYCNESAMFLKKGILRSSLGNPLHLEVIGNIHDNPELLEG